MRIYKYTSTRDIYASPPVYMFATTVMFDQYVSHHVMLHHHLCHIHVAYPVLITSGNMLFVPYHIIHIICDHYLSIKSIFYVYYDKIIGR